MDANNNALAILRRAVLPSRRDSDKTRAVAVGALPSPLLSTPISTTIIAFSTQQQQGRTGTAARTRTPHMRITRRPAGRCLDSGPGSHPSRQQTGRGPAGGPRTYVKAIASSVL